ncbi:MAG: hypothetical protein A2086_11185 [Spirochaetes bacterium GWD1_27_9]|nr:MAG: hypothetical protein A2Y34_03195 [Spirochaetes bacterium GWC1_27_15]OHD41541.1 MAG: hypothetical protein A2086_11185 [Spirochaetes bacterium GWD1_27_9]
MLEKLIFLFLAFIFMGCTSTADTVINNTTTTTTTTTTISSQLIRLNINAPSLANNIVNESATQAIAVYLPPSYKLNTTQTYPVIYFLPGFSNTVDNFLSSSFVSLKQSMDNLITKNTIKEAILVIVNGKNIYGGSFYTNSDVTGNWDDFVSKDVINYIDTNYRTIKKANSRAICGHSMGGSGAITIGMKHSDIFGLVYALSPGLFDTNGLNDALTTWDSYFMNAYGRAFAPNLAKNPPYDDVNANRVKWESGFGNLTEKISTYKTNLNSLKLLTVEYGFYDYYSWIPKGCVYFNSLLTTNNIKNNLYKHNGDHESLLKSRIEQVMLPELSNNFEYQ